MFTLLTTQHNFNSNMEMVGEYFFHFIPLHNLELKFYISNIKGKTQDIDNSNKKGKC